MNATRRACQGVVLGALLAFASMPAGAQQLQLEPAPASENTVEPPGPRETMGAYRAVRAWVDAGAAPEAYDASPTLPGCAGASVVLMQGGRVVGRGEAMSRPGDAPGLVIWRAAGEAIGAWSQRRVGADAEQDAGLGWGREPVRISLELAGAPVPLTDAELTTPALSLAPGLDGVAVRRGDTLLATFPGTILRRNSDAGRAIGALAARVSGDVGAALEPTPRLAERGLIVYRFRVSHVAEPRAGAAAVFLQRGGRVINPHELTTPALAEFAQGLGEHLASRRWPGVERFGLLGVYDPVAGRHEAMIEEPVAQAVAAMALARLARTPGIDHEQRRRAHAAAVGILSDLAVVEEAERLAPTDPQTGEAVAPPPAPAWEEAASAAASVVALGELGADTVARHTELSALRDRVLARLDKAYTPSDGFTGEIPVEARGLVAYGLVRAHTVFGRGDGTPARAAVSDVYRDTPSAVLVGQMPWLGWADIELSRAQGRAVASATLLREMRAEVWAHQLRAHDAGPDEADLVGGVVFTRGRTPLPTWHTLRPVALIATMLGDQTLTPGWARGGEAPGELLRLLDSIRFLRQLAAGEAAGHMYSRPERAEWGVRQALWDQRMPTDATSLGLLSVCEALRSLDELGRRAPESP